MGSILVGYKSIFRVAKGEMMDVAMLNTVLSAIGLFLVAFLAVLGAIWWEIRALREDFAAERARVAELITVVEVLRTVIKALPCKKGECDQN